MSFVILGTLQIHFFSKRKNIQESNRTLLNIFILKNTNCVYNTIDINRCLFYSHLVNFLYFLNLYTNNESCLILSLLL